MICNVTTEQQFYYVIFFWTYTAYIIFGLR